MKKKILNTIRLFLPLLIHLNSFSQVTVLDRETKQSISYVTLQPIGQVHKIISDVNGIFQYPETFNASDTLLFSCTGYKPATIPFQALQSISVIELEPVVQNLAEVHVAAQQRNDQTKKLGVTKTERVAQLYSYTGKNGEEKAVWIPNPYSSSGFLKKVHIYLTDSGFPDAAIRIHIYACNPLEKKPGQELTQSNRIVSGTSGNEWVSVDVSQDHIQVGENGCFISIEWFDSPKAKNYSDTFVLKEANNQDVIKIQSGNGAVLGSVAEPYRLSKNKLWYRNKSNEWVCWSLTDESRFNIKDTINNNYIRVINENNLYYHIPGIYADVSFNKKKLSPAFEAPKKRPLNKIERVKEDAFNYPQATVQELFHSLIKGFEQNNIVYVLKFLCVYKEHESEAIAEEVYKHLETDGMLMTETEKRQVIEHLTEIIRSIDVSELVKVGAHQFELRSDNWRYNLVVENGKWKINPYSYRIIE